MEMKIISEKKNPIFDRKEVAAQIQSNATPTREDVIKFLAEKFSVPQEAVKIKGIHGKFGVREFNVEANIYGSKESKESLEIKKKKESEAEKRKAEAETAAKKTEEKVEEKAAEAPKEDEKPEGAKE